MNSKNQLRVHGGRQATEVEPLAICLGPVPKVMRFLGGGVGSPWHSWMASEEINRWDHQQPGTDALRRLQEAQNIITDLARATLPRRSHTQLADLLRQLGETSRILHSENSE